jgi:hypothetical protein
MHKKWLYKLQTKVGIARLHPLLLPHHQHLCPVDSLQQSVLHSQQPLQWVKY